MNINTVVHKHTPLTNDDAKRLLAAGLLRAASRHARQGPAAVALGAGCCKRAIEKAMAMETLPAGETLVNLLLACPTALDELLAAVGYRITPLVVAEAQDLDLVESLGAVMGALAKSRSPNSPGGVGRVPQETLMVASLARGVLPTLTAIVREADGIRGVA